MKLQGKKITLRKLKPSDEDRIFRYAKDRDISRYMTARFPYPYFRRHAKAFIKRSLEEMGKKELLEYSFGIALKDTDEIVGAIGIHHIDRRNKKATIGYWIAKPHWRQGMATEAVDLACRFIFRDLKLQRVSANVFHPNKASARVLEKVGFRSEGRLRKSVRRGNKQYDELVYGLLKEDFI